MQRDLVLRAKTGDHEAFSALAAASIARLHRVARLILRDDERASDAVQDALVAAWLDIRAVRDPEHFDAWLHRVLVRACYREARRHRRRRIVEVHIDAIDVADMQRPAPGADLATRDLLDRAFRRLTPELRAALVVHHYLGLRDAEAAESLGIPSGTFKSRLHRATDALRAALDAEERASGHAQESIA